MLCEAQQQVLWWCVVAGINVREPPRGAAGAKGKFFLWLQAKRGCHKKNFPEARAGGGCSDKNTVKTKGAYSLYGMPKSARSSLHGYIRARMRTHVAMQSAKQAGGYVREPPRGAAGAVSWQEIVRARVV